MTDFEKVSEYYKNKNILTFDNIDDLNKPYLNDIINLIYTKLEFLNYTELLCLCYKISYIYKINSDNYFPNYFNLNINEQLLYKKFNYDYEPKEKTIENIFSLLSMVKKFTYDKCIVSVMYYLHWVIYNIYKLIYFENINFELNI
jgi:hypothetical protein